uniref:Uncharacterized protein n=1 Tax=viral metagenome TaxID=1070528 RepID=A0A6M3LZL6_9ZZZZ
MIIKEQRGKQCPLGYDFDVGDVSCEECDHFIHEFSEHVNEQGVNASDEYCKLLKEAEG